MIDIVLDAGDIRGYLLHRSTENLGIETMKIKTQATEKRKEKKRK